MEKIVEEKLIEVKIEKIITGGKGMGRHDGKVVFADYCAVGDEALIKVRKEKKNYIVGEVVEIKEPSQDRISSECRYFGSCGGCDFWHVSYETELRYKKAIFLETLRKIGKIELDDVKIYVSPKVKHYRNRVGLKVKNVGGKILLGFYKKETKRVVDIDECLITSEKINGLITPVRALIGGLSFGDKILQVDVTVDDRESEVFMTIHVIGDDLSAVRSELSDAARRHLPDDVKVFVQMGRRSTVAALFDDDDEAAMTYRVTNSNGDFSHDIALSAGAFLQVNYAQNIKLIDIALEYLGLSADDSVLDLFCGAGNFAFAVSGLCKEVTGVESYAPAIKDAVKNMERLKINNAKFVCADVSREVDRLAKADAMFDSIIIDPPREGAIGALKNIKSIVKKNIVYISCDIATFARDAEYLKSVGFTLKEVRLVDMFPRTHHVEVAAKFTL